ncbi:MAG TPA: DUF5808 domain-containing protein [Streptosporangiaceae bacterium]|nr:DUF5808 domain-containing protein [Streptosporangiaceae bacterium]
MAIGSTAAALVLAGSASSLPAAVVLPVELAAGLGCFLVARERIAAVKSAEDWFSGLRQIVAADTSWRTDPIRFPVAWLIPAVAVLVATAAIGAARYPTCLAALRDWQVYRLSGIGAALPVLPAAVGLVILVAVAVRTGQAGSRLPGPAGRASPDVNRDDDRFWKGGLIYINRDDPAIMVGSRFGIGWTPNLGNLRGCLLYGGILAAIVALVVIRAVAGT